MIKNTKLTVASCTVCIVSQAITNNICSLLFIYYASFYHSNLAQLSSIVSVNFITQILVDYLTGQLSLRISYKAFFLISSISSTAALASLTLLPKFIPFMAAAMFFAVLGGIGGGITEVMASAEIEALPVKNRTRILTLVHSSYGWGYVCLVLFTSLFLTVFNEGTSWQYLPLAFAAVPFINCFLLIKAPMFAIPTESDEKTSVLCKRLFSTSMFFVLILIMMMSGACEHAMCQWASFFAQTGLGLSKIKADILGPCGFAFTMALSRTMGGLGRQKDSANMLLLSSAICVLLFLGVVLIPSPVGKMICCALCGASVGLMWPLSLSFGAKFFPWAGTYIFGLLSLAGAAGCSVGPAVVGRIAEKTDFKTAFAVASIMPLILFLAVVYMSRKEKIQLRHKRYAGK